LEQINVKEYGSKELESSLNCCSEFPKMMLNVQA